SRSDHGRWRALSLPWIRTPRRTINPLRHEENTMMTAEQKKELVRRYYQEIWTEGNLAFADRVFTDDYVNRDPASPGGCVEGREGFKHLVAALRGAFQDMRMTIDHQHV